MESNQQESDKSSTIKRRAKFTLGELGGAFGDWGTLIPFIIGYVSIVGMNPAGIFFCIGFTNIILGIRFNLPLPVEPQKTIGTVAIFQKWTPNLVISTGFGTGIVWAILGFSGKLEKIVKKVPIVIVRGIQLGLGLILGWTGIILFSDDFLLGIISIIIILIFIKSEKVPSAVILMFIGIFLLFFTETIVASDIIFNLPKLEFNLPSLENLLIGMILAGIAQLFLTLTNVMIATVSLIKDLFPDVKTTINSNSLAINMGMINIVSPFLGGMPMCHGSGGLAAQYAFGARTGGSMIMEGILELFLGLFFSDTLFLIFTVFPQAILGSMLCYTAFLLGKIAFKDFQFRKIPIILVSAILSFIFNITIGFLIGLGLYLIFRKKIENKTNNKNP